MRYLTQPRKQRYVEDYGFFYFTFMTVNEK